MKVRHVVLKFYTDLFVTFPGEGIMWNIMEKQDHSGASFISDALDFFSQSHRLQSLVLSFEESYRGMAGFSILFSKDSRLYRQEAYAVQSYRKAELLCAAE